MSCEITYGNSKNKGCLIPGKSTYRFSGRNNKHIKNDKINKQTTTELDF